MMLCNLPLDILLEQTLPCLDVSNLSTLSSTCRLFYILCNDDRVWKERVVSDFGLLLPLNTKQYTWKQLYIELDQGQRIYTWGENSDKRLGFGDQDNSGRDAFLRQITIPRELRGLRSKGIVDIVAGGWSFHALDRRGQVWMWGWMQPRHPLIIPPQQDLVRQPMCVRFPTQVRIRVIASGKLHAVALDHQGRLWHWANSWKPQEVHITKATGPITHITAHWNYSTALTATGEVFLIPFPISPKYMVVTSEPIHKNEQFVKVAGLDDASIALTRTGQVFKLHFASLQSQSNDSSACDVTELKRFSYYLQHASCGTLFDYRRAVLSAQAQQFAICSQGKALLGHENSMADDEPQVLDTGGHDIQKVTFGNFHYGALTTEGRLLTWGLYSSGALGRGYEDDQNETAPEIVEKLQDMFVFAVGFGGYHSGCAAIPRKLLHS